MATNIEELGTIKMSSILQAIRATTAMGFAILKGTVTKGAITITEVTTMKVLRCEQKEVYLNHPIIISLIFSSVDFKCYSVGYSNQWAKVVEAIGVAISTMDSYFALIVLKEAIIIIFKANAAYIVNIKVVIIITIAAKYVVKEAIVAYNTNFGFIKKAFAKFMDFNVNPSPLVITSPHFSFRFKQVNLS